MKGLGRVVVGSIAGGLLGAATFFREATEMAEAKSPRENRRSKTLTY